MAANQLKDASRPRFRGFSHAGLILAFSLLLLLPAFLLGAGGADLQNQSLWVRFFNQQFWSGELYPRWLRDLNAGDGSPVFFYYPPLAYFVTALFAFLAPLDTFGYYPMAASAGLALFISGITFYLWMKEEGVTPAGAIAGSMLYMAAPFHVAVAFYFALLFSTVWAFAWIPLCLLFAKRVALRSDLLSIAGLALSLCMLMTTNEPMTIMFGPVVVGYCLIFFRKGQIVKQMRALGFALLLGFGLSAIYLLPAQLYLQFANVSLLWHLPAFMGGDYRNKFLAVGLGNINDAAYLTYWCGTLLMAVLCYRLCPPGKQRIFALCVTLAALFLMLRQSEVVWFFMPLLQVLQLPLRFFCVTTVFLPFLMAASFSRARYPACGLIAVFCVITFTLATETRTTPDSFRKAAPRHYKSYLLGIDQYATYLTSPDLFARFYSDDGIRHVEAEHQETEVIDGHARITVTAWQPRAIELDYEAQAPSIIRIRQFDFPGFRAFDWDAEREIGRDGDTGRILLHLPAGRGHVRLLLTALLPEKLGAAVSALSAGLVLLICLLGLRKRRA